MRTAEFKLIETEPAEFGIIAQDTVIHIEGALTLDTSISLIAQANGQAQLFVNQDISLVISIALKHCWKNTQVLRIDEVSMVNGRFFKLLSSIATNIRPANKKPFGGIKVGGHW
ncbi:hypothetical protein C8J56DRAFT_1166146 [Mycena floridula]|nr:hypothetical protein C8J56DRAFT_1166146 [Mycena floridula]